MLQPISELQIVPGQYLQNFGIVPPLLGVDDQGVCGTLHCIQSACRKARDRIHKRTLLIMPPCFGLLILLRGKPVRIVRSIAVLEGVQCVRAEIRSWGRFD